MFDHTILVVSMWILSYKGTGAVPGQTQKQQTMPGLRLVQVSLQECIQVIFLILSFILHTQVPQLYKLLIECTLFYSMECFSMLNYHLILNMVKTSLRIKLHKTSKV